MLDKFDLIKNRFNEVSELISSPDIVSDRKKYIDLSKEYKELNKIIEKFKTYELTLSNESEALDLIKDESDPEIQDIDSQVLLTHLLDYHTQNLKLDSYQDHNNYDYVQ